MDSPTAYNGPAKVNRTQSQRAQLQHHLPFPLAPYHPHILSYSQLSKLIDTIASLVAARLKCM
jgi:hypothetical protein